MIQTYQNTHKRQQKSAKTPKIKASPLWRINDTRQVETSTQSLSPSRLHALNQVLYYLNIFSDNRVSQIRMALYTGFRRETINRALKDLMNLGLISYINYGVKKRCKYIAHPHFNDTALRHRLSRLLPALKILPLILLTVVGYIDAVQNVTQYKYQGLNTTVLSYTKKKELLSVHNGYEQSVIRGPGAIKEYAMSKAVHPYIRETLSDILPLTTTGICKLMAFEESVIRTAMEKVLKIKDVHKPYNMLIKMCMQATDQQGGRANWRLTADMCQALGVDPKGDCVQYQGYKKGATAIAGAVAHDPSIKKDPTKGKVEAVVRQQCHPICKYLTVCTYLSGATFHYRDCIPPRDRVLDEDDYTAAKRVMDNYKTPAGERSLRLYGMVNPWLDRVTPEQKESLTDDLRQHSNIDAPRVPNMLTKLAQKIKAATPSDTFSDGAPIVEPGLDDSYFEEVA